MRTAQQRRAYIDTSRRTQPLAELARKSAKAKPRRPRVALEAADLLFARCWRSLAEVRATTGVIALFRGTYCRLCGAFAPSGTAVTHRPRCSANPVDDGPFPGWHAAGREIAIET